MTIKRIDGISKPIKPRFDWSYIDALGVTV